MRRPGKANDAAELFATLPDVQQRAAKAFPHAQAAITAFQPTLNFARSYTPDIFNGFGKLGDGLGLLRRQRQLRPGLNLPTRTSSIDAAAAKLEPINRAQQFEAFGPSAAVHRRCPGGATQSAPDNSNPFVDPPWAGASVTPSECNPSDAPPGP